MTAETFAPGIADGVRRHPEAAATTGLALLAGVGVEGVGPFLAKASVVVHPLDPELADNLTVHVTPARDGATYLNLIGAEVRLPRVHSGFRITPFAADTPFNSQRTLQTYASLVARPKGAEQAIRQQYDQRELQYDIGSGLMLPFLGAAVFKYLAHRRADEKPSLFHRHPLRAVLGVCVALAGVGYGSHEAYDTYEHVTASKFGDCRPARLPGRTVETQDIEICGTNAKPILHWARKIIRTVNEGQDYWDKTTSGFIGAWRKFQHSDQYRKLLGPDRVAGLAISGSHCNYGYMDSLLPAIVSATKPDFALVGGDVYIHNGSTPLEANCYDELLGKLPVGRSIKGNHDPQKPQPGDIGSANGDVSTLPGINLSIVGAPDPRSFEKSQQGELAGDTLDKAFAQQDLSLAHRACEVMKQTGFRPIVEVHDADAAGRVIRSGCASVVNTGHGRANYWEPRLVPVRGETGETGYHATTVTAAGYAGGYYDIISPARRPGSAILEVFDRYSHELVGALVISYGPKLGDIAITAHEFPASDIYDETRNLHPNDFERRF